MPVANTTIRHQLEAAQWRPVFILQLELNQKSLEWIAFINNMTRAQTSANYIAQPANLSQTLTWCSAAARLKIDLTGDRQKGPRRRAPAFSSCGPIYKREISLSQTRNRFVVFLCGPHHIWSHAHTHTHTSVVWREFEMVAKCVCVCVCVQEEDLVFMCLFL